MTNNDDANPNRKETDENMRAKVMAPVTIFVVLTFSRPPGAAKVSQPGIKKVHVLSVLGGTFDLTVNPPSLNDFSLYKKGDDGQRVAVLPLLPKKEQGALVEFREKFVTLEFVSGKDTLLTVKATGSWTSVMRSDDDTLMIGVFGEKKEKGPVKLAR